MPEFVGPLESDGESSPFFGMYSAGPDLRSAGYAEEEFFVRGTGAVYGPRHPNAPEAPTLSRVEIVPMGAVVQPDVPYTTRILVRSPIDATRFSGTVHLEVF